MSAHGGGPAMYRGYVRRKGRPEGYQVMLTIVHDGQEVAQVA
jgi:hypothetical protein